MRRKRSFRRSSRASQRPVSFMHQPLGPDRTRVGVLVQKHESSLEFFQQIAHFLDITTEFLRAPGVAIRYSCFCRSRPDG